MDQNESILPVLMEDEMKSSYLDYSMSVIVSRALPDIRDGLKPVHRRILYAMSELGMDPSKPHKKSARLVGEVLGKYHPHGDGAVYDAMVRLAQPWSMRYPLVDGQGNFGSIDGDPPAAMRYTEVRLAKPALDVLRDIDKGTVDFRGNFDDSLEEPTVLPTVLPTLLVNGAGGIAVGMATNIPPHNLRDISRGIKAIVENPDIDIDELIKIVKAPDFPTGGTIYGYSGVIDAYKTGRGKVVVRAKSVIETTKTGKETIVITEIPYQVNKSTLIEKIAFLVRSKVIEGISDIRDESDRDGMRLVIDLKRDANPQVLLNNLYKHTQLQNTFGVIMLALQNGRPKVFNLKEMMQAYIAFRVSVIVRRSLFELDVAEKRAHILEGFLKVFGGTELAGGKVAEDRVDQIVQTIKSATNVKDASEKLQAEFDLTEIQAKAVLELRLQRLTAMERDKIIEEYNKLKETIARLNFILATPSEQLRIAMEELDEVVHKFGDERRTDISFDAHDMSLEDMIENEDVIITVSREGLIKRTPTKTYRTQNRGGRGVLGAGTHEEDSVEHMFYAKTHDYLMFFTDRGRCYRIKIYDLPEGSRTAKGRSLANVIQKDPDEKVTAFLAIKAFVDDHFIFFTTQKGKVKRVKLSEFESVRVTGKIAISLDDDDKLLAVNLTTGSSHIIIGTRNGMACHFKEKGVRAMGRTAAGVRGIRLAKDDIVVAMVVVNDPENEQILVVAELGYGKRSPIIVPDDEIIDGEGSEEVMEEVVDTTEDSGADGDGEEEIEVDNRKFVFRLTKRGGKGVRSMKVTDKTGKVVSMLSANDELDLIVISENGIIIRQEMKRINIIGRNTQGVRLIRLDSGDRISDITTILHEEEEEVIDEANVVETSTPSTDAIINQSSETENSNDEPTTE